MSIKYYFLVLCTLIDSYGLKIKQTAKLLPWYEELPSVEGCLLTDILPNRWRVWASAFIFHHQRFYDLWYGCWVWEFRLNRFEGSVSVEGCLSKWNLTVREVFKCSFFVIIIVYTCGVVAEFGCRFWTEVIRHPIVREKDRTLAYLSSSLVST